MVSSLCLSLTFMTMYIFITVGHLKTFLLNSPCGSDYLVDHAHVCKLSGFIYMRHNDLTSFSQSALKKVYNDVELEPLCNLFLVNLFTIYLPTQMPVVLTFKSEDVGQTATMHFWFTLSSRIQLQYGERVNKIEHALIESI